MALSENSSNTNVPAVHGENTAGGDAVVGRGGRGVVGFSQDNAGVVGDSQNFHAVFGISHSPNNGGVIGINDAGGWGVIGRGESNTGVSGESKTGRGVHGISETWQGVFGYSRDNAGIVGESPLFHAVYGVSHSVNNAGVFGTNDAGGFGVAGISERGIGVNGKGGTLAGRFEGDVEVWGDIRLTNADCAEDFDIADAASVEPGTIMVLGEEGVLHQSHQAYDKCVAGVISGAGDYKPGIVLDKQQARGNRKSIALLGKVFCKVDASYASIEVGDLLTTSPTPGHAMKADDPFKAFGAVIGKALRPLQGGQGLIPMLIALQ